LIVTTIRLLYLAPIVGVAVIMGLWDNSTESTDCPGIVVSARVHPGETNSSWVMEGFLNYLLSDCDQAKVR